MTSVYSVDHFKDFFMKFGIVLLKYDFLTRLVLLLLCIGEMASVNRPPEAACRIQS